MGNGLDELSLEMFGIDFVACFDGGYGFILFVLLILDDLII